jgi:hypothetical protein
MTMNVGSSLSFLDAQKQNKKSDDERWFIVIF